MSSYDSEEIFCKLLGLISCVKQVTIQTGLNIIKWLHLHIIQIHTHVHNIINLRLRGTRSCEGPLAGA